MGKHSIKNDNTKCEKSPNFPQPFFIKKKKTISKYKRETIKYVNKQKINTNNDSRLFWVVEGPEIKGVV